MGEKPKIRNNPKILEGQIQTIEILAHVIFHEACDVQAQIQQNYWD